MFDLPTDIYLPVNAKAPNLLRSVTGAQRPNRLQTDGQKNPCEIPCTTLHTMTPQDPNLIAAVGTNIQAAELIAIAPIKNLFAPYNLANDPAII